MIAAWTRWLAPADTPADGNTADARGWTALPWILTGGFVFRVILGLATDSWAHPDECFQYLEQAHRLTFGYGFKPWEYDYGIRSWIISGFIAALLWPFKVMGIDSPYIYQPAVEIVFSAISLVLPYAMYRIGKSLVSEQVGRLALVFGAFWYELAVLGHRPLADALATYALFACLALVLQPARKGMIIGAGAVAALAILLRFQLVPIVGIVVLIALWRWRTRVWPAIPAFLVVFLAGGALDYYAWGVWFSSIITNFQMNAAHDVASGFGVHPPWWYLDALLISTWGLAFLGFAGLGLSWRKSWPLIMVAAAQLGFFTLVSHKELRFILPVTPAWLIGAAMLVHAAPRLGWIKAPVRAWVAPAIGLACVVVSIVALAGKLPRYYVLFSPRAIEAYPVREAYRFLSTQTDVRAVLDATNREWGYMGSYYDLHQEAPLYLTIVSSQGRPFAKGGREAFLDPGRYVSHIVRLRTSAPRQGFAQIRIFGDVAVDRRETDIGPLPVAGGFDYRLRPDVPLPPQTVTPRW